MKTQHEIPLHSEFATHQWLEQAADRLLDHEMVEWCPPIVWHSDHGVFEAWILWPDIEWERVFTPHLKILPSMVVARIVTRMSSRN